jgi:hypothetical protein
LFLSKHNSHERDQYIQFQEVGHKYTIFCDTEHKYTSVTTWCHSHFPKFDADSIIRNMMRGKNWAPGHKYWGLTAQQIKDMWKNNGSSVASAGTDLHYRIECFMNCEEIDGEDTAVKNHSQLLETPLAQDDGTIPEWTYFLNFVRDHPEFKPYRTEWMVFWEEMKISGTRKLFFSKGERKAFYFPTNIDHEVLDDQFNKGKKAVRIGFDLPKGGFLWRQNNKTCN